MTSGRLDAWSRLFGPGFVSLVVSVDGRATLTTTSGSVRLVGLDRAEAALAARALQRDHHLLLWGFSGAMACLRISRE